MNKSTLAFISGIAAGAAAAAFAVKKFRKDDPLTNAPAAPRMTDEIRTRIFHPSWEKPIVVEPMAAAVEPTPPSKPVDDPFEGVLNPIEGKDEEPETAAEEVVEEALMEERNDEPTDQPTVVETVSAEEVTPAVAEQDTFPDIHQEEPESGGLIITEPSDTAETGDSEAESEVEVDIDAYYHFVDAFSALAASGEIIPFNEEWLGATARLDHLDLLVGEYDDGWYITHCTLAERRVIVRIFGDVVTAIYERYREGNPKVITWASTSAEHPVGQGEFLTYEEVVEFLAG